MGRKTLPRSKVRQEMKKGIVIKPTKNGGFRYTCSCEYPDLHVNRFEDLYCESCDSWRAWPTKEELQEAI